MQRKINFNAKENVVHLNYLNVQLESANEQCHEVNKRAKKKNHCGFIEYFSVLNLG